MESSLSLFPTKNPLNHGLCIGYLAHDYLPNRTIGDLYSLPVTILNAVMLSFLMSYLVQTNAIQKHNHGTMLRLMSRGWSASRHLARTALNHVRSLPAINLLAFSAIPWLWWRYGGLACTCTLSALNFAAPVRPTLAKPFPNHVAKQFSFAPND